MAELRARGIELPPPPPNDVMSLDVSDTLASLTVRNVPNPIRSERTTVFSVQGAGSVHVDEIRVDVYDLSGLRIFTQRTADLELVWPATNNAGELLANGVYLYQVLVKIGEIWYPMGSQKLAIVR